MTSDGLLLTSLWLLASLLIFSKILYKYPKINTSYQHYIAVFIGIASVLLLVLFLFEKIIEKVM